MTKDEVLGLNTYAREVFEKDGFHTPLVIGFKEQQQVLIPVGELMKNSRSKELLAMMLKHVVQQMGLDGLIMITECWVHRSNGLKDHTTKQIMDGEITVSQLRPEDRKEALMIQAESKEGWTMAITNEIVRDGEDKPTLKEADVMDNGSDIGGRFTNWFGHEGKPEPMCPDKINMSLEVPDTVPPIMQEAASKVPAIEGFLDNLSQASFGRTRTGSIGQQTCVACGQPATSFRDDKSEKEYTISGFCQVCQDGVFGRNEE